MEITLNHRLCRTHDEVLAAATPQVADFLDEWFSPADFVWGHTSGSTGTPKPLKLSKRDMEESARLTVDFFGITADTTMLLCLSPDYIAGKMMIVRTLLSGADLLVTGDASQRDVTGVGGLESARRVLEGIDDVSFVDLDRNDIVRHTLVARIVDAYAADAAAKAKEQSHG